MNRHLQHASTRRLVAAAALLALPAACGGSAYRARQSSPPAPLPVADTHPAPSVESFTVSAEVHVVLSAGEGLEELLLEPSGRGPVQVVRAGDFVLSTDGRAVRELIVEGTSRLGGVSFQGRSYPGRIRVLPRSAGGLRLINEIDLESYVEGVVAAELPLWSAEPAELRAQAIAVRTYALHTLGQRMLERGSSGTFLWDSVEDQAYRGRYEPPRTNRGEVAAAERLGEAVRATRGQVLSRDGRLVDARFHAACGGRTSDLAEIFPGAHDPSEGVECEPCRRRSVAGEHADASNGPPIHWKHTFDGPSLDQAAMKLGVGKKLLSCEPARTDTAGRWIEVSITGPEGSMVLGQEMFRRTLGFTTMKSTLVEGQWPPAGQAITGGLMLRGRGRGHGVGLCQEGARGYARMGWLAGDILRHYYTDATIERLPAF